MRAAYRQVRTIAQRFLALYEPHLPPPELARALAACAAFIAERVEIDPDDAYDVALSAWSERSGRATRCYVDLDVSTPWLVFVADPEAGTRYPIPLADLVRMLGPRLVTQDGRGAGEG
ncbi:hypothetical protein [Phenylobacterium sp.]|uniref:hypothetical protein n=1 Tax=Phenylobacterium sp. TaxID=1871053 RepID=UPI00301CE509